MKSFLELFDYQEIYEESYDNVSIFEGITYENIDYKFAWFDAKKSEVLMFNDDDFDNPELKFKVYGLRKL